MKIKTVKALKKETKHVTDVTAEWEELKETTQPISGFENIPSVSVQDNDLIKVEFLGEPEQRKTKDGKEVAYAIVKMLAPHVGFDREKREEVNLKAGDKASINLKRHKILWMQTEKHVPLTGKKLIIGVVGEIPTKRGKPAKDYRFKEL